MSDMRRREFIMFLGGAAAAWPLAVRAEGERIRRIGVLINLAADDAEGQARLAAFVQDLQQLGWTDGRNVRIDYRWAAGDARLFHRYAEELLALAPERHFGLSHPKRSGTAAGDPHRAHRVRDGRRPGRHGRGREPGAPGRQRHRIYEL
jgi:hypothetical protein